MSHFHPLKITDITKETPECVSIAFEVPEELREQYQFSHGQNITLKLMVEGEELRRSYSICSSPYENELRVAVKKMTAGRFSNYVNSQLHVGDVIEVLPPSGKFYTELDREHTKNYLAFAAGSGITPILSIIKTTLAVEPNSSFTLVYGNRNRTSIIFKEQLDALKNRFMNRFSVHHILSREKTDASIYHGRVTPEKCEELNGKLIDVLAADEIFLCGPEEMIFGVKAWLEQKGVPRKHIHFELFVTPGQKVTTDLYATTLTKPRYEGKLSHVTVRQDGITFEFDLEFEGLSVLDAALKQGADLPFACKGGVCATCKAKLIDGQVEMETNYALEPDETDAGFILTCQSHPRSEKIVVDFDAK